MFIFYAIAGWRSSSYMIIIHKWIISYYFLLQKDIKANARECEGQEVLRIRAYGSSFFTLGINIRFFLFHVE